MRIAMIGHKRIPSREGGVEIVVEELAVRMAEKGHSVTVYNRGGHHVAGAENDSDEFLGKEYKGVCIKKIPTPDKKSLNAVVYAFLATVQALFSKYDVIHFHAEGSCSMLWLPKLFGIRTVATIHGLDWKRAKWGGFATKFLLFGERTAAKKADAIIVLSLNIQEYFRKVYGRETVYIPNGISIPVKRPMELIQSKFGLEKENYILFLARIVPEKGLHYLIEAYGKIDTEMPLVIAGGGSHTDEYVEKIWESAQKSNRIIMTGFVQGKLLEELYSNCYLYVLPSDIEGMPLSLLEAMSYGRRCLVSDIPENLETTGGLADCFKKSDIDDLEKQLRRIIGEKKSRENTEEEKSAARIAYVADHFNWDSVTEKTMTVYHNHGANND